MVMPATRHRFTIDAYLRMVETGILTEADRVELLDGELLHMTPAGPRHAAVVARLQHGILAHTGSAVILFVQSPIALGPDAAPEPDLAVLRPRSDFYAAALPTAADVLLLIEVADSSLATDRSRKVPAYARAGIPEAWLVNLESDCVECYRDPAGRTWRHATVHRPGEILTPLALPGLALSVGDVLLI